MKVIAVDSAGNEFIKEVIVFKRKDRKILSFGWPIEYDLDDEKYGLIRHYPFKKDLCIDMGGRNHKGSPDVCISAKQLNSVIEHIKENE